MSAKTYKYPPKPIPQLTTGYYWLKNYSDLMEKWFYRPVLVTVVNTPGYVFGNHWTPTGTYVQMIGTDRNEHLTYYADWEGIEFIPLPEPV